MKFRQFLLSELDHYSLEAPQTINGIQCDGMDFRFEDWPKGFNPQKSMMAGGSPDEVQMMPQPKTFILKGSYRAPCKEGWFVVDKRNTGKSSGGMGGGPMAMTATRPDIQVIAQVTPEIEELPAMPPSWFRFAVLYMGNDVVKEPEWPRGDYEKVKAVGRTELKPNPFRVES